MHALKHETHVSSLMWLMSLGTSDIPYITFGRLANEEKKCAHITIYCGNCSRLAHS